MTISHWQNPTKRNLPDLPIRMLEIPDNHRDKRSRLFVPGSDQINLFLAISNRLKQSASEGGERRRGEVTSCVLVDVSHEERDRWRRKSAGRGAFREQGGVPVDINTASGPFTPSGTDTKIISSFAAYENSPVKHLVPPRARSSFSIPDRVSSSCCSPSSSSFNSQSRRKNCTLDIVV